MKTEITEESILFKMSFFSVVIPRENNDIEYIFQDLTASVGLPLRLIVMPKIYKTNLWGKICMAIRYFVYAGNIPYLLFKNPLTFRTLVIEERKEIENFLNELKIKGYEVEKPLQEYKEISDEITERQHKMNTKEYKNNRIASLVTILFVFLEGSFSLAYFLGSDNLLKDAPFFLKVTLGIVVFCLGLYYLVRKK